MNEIALKALPTPRGGVQFGEGNPRTASRGRPMQVGCEIALLVGPEYIDFRCDTDFSAGEFDGSV